MLSAHDFQPETPPNVRREWRRRAPDGGYTLVELLIYSGLLVLILTVVGGMLMNTLTSQQKVLKSAGANASSQIIAESVQNAVRNATALTLTQGADPDTQDQLLVAVTVSNDPSTTANARVCQAWYYSEAGGAIYYRRATVQQKIIAPTTEQLADNNMTGWSQLGLRITANRTASGSVQPIFTALTVGNPAIALNFAINVKDTSSPALISTTAITRHTATEASSLCS